MGKWEGECPLRSLGLREALMGIKEPLMVLEWGIRAERFLFFMGSDAGMGNVLELLGRQLWGWAANQLEGNTGFTGSRPDEPLS